MLKIVILSGVMGQQKTWSECHPESMPYHGVSKRCRVWWELKKLTAHKVMRLTPLKHCLKTTKQNRI